MIDSRYFFLLPFPMFRPRHTLLYPHRRSTLVPPHSFPNLRAQRLARPGRGFGAHDERLGASSSPPPESIPEPPSGSHPMHAVADASLLCSLVPAWHVALGRGAKHSDLLHCSLREQKESNPRANNTFIFNNLQMHIPATPANSGTYKI